MTFQANEKTEQEKLRELIDIVTENNDAAKIFMCAIHAGFLKEDDGVRDGLQQIINALNPMRPREKIMGHGLLNEFMDAADRDYTPQARRWLAEIVATAQKVHPSLFDEDLKKKARAFYQTLDPR